MNSELDLCEACDGMLMIEPPEDAEDGDQMVVHCYGCGASLVYAIQEVRYFVTSFVCVEGGE